MKALASLVAIIFAASLTACVDAEPHDVNSYEDRPEAQLEDNNSQADLTAEVNPSLLSSWDEQMSTDDPIPGGRVRFKTYGDIVEVCDIEADGRGVDLYYNGQHVHVGGYGNCETRRASYGGVWDLAEGYVYHFRICLDGSLYCDDAYWYNGN